MDTTETEQAQGGITARRYAQLVEQRRYELSVRADGLEALLEPYALSSSELGVPSQRRGSSES